MIDQQDMLDPRVPGRPGSTSPELSDGASEQSIQVPTPPIPSRAIGDRPDMASYNPFGPAPDSVPHLPPHRTDTDRSTDSVEFNQILMGGQHGGDVDEMMSTGFLGSEAKGLSQLILPIRVPNTHAATTTGGPNSHPTGGGPSSAGGMEPNTFGEAGPNTQTTNGPVLPPRPLISISSPLDPISSNTAPTESPNHQQLLQDTYTVALRHISPSAPPAPILMQDRNGPCPLIALINAMMLSGSNPQLATLLRGRKKLTLGEVLEGMVSSTFDRVLGKGPLVDMDAIQAFLGGLHTGMTVNPCFVLEDEAHSELARPNWPGPLPGTFGPSDGLASYRLFGFPIIHGWLPEAGEKDAMGATLLKHAPTWDDAQTAILQLRSLEDRLENGQELSEDELRLVGELCMIDSFLSSTQDQMTSWGAQVVADWMIPGTVVVLFRNNHFSTLYRHPESLLVFQLVTDAGIIGANERIVWESLGNGPSGGVDFFTAEFESITDSSGRSQGWNGAAPLADEDRSTVATVGAATANESAEQVDSDLALARALQEEEYAAQRRMPNQTTGPSNGRSSWTPRPNVAPEPPRRAASSPMNRGRGGGGMRGNNAMRAQPPPPRRMETTTGPYTPNQPQTRSYTNSSRPNRQLRPVSLSTTTLSTRSSRGNLAPSPTAPRPASARTSPTRPPLTHRQEDQSGEAPPPSYAYAVRMAPFMPPVGHPMHPSSFPQPDGVPVPAQAPQVQAQQAPDRGRPLAQRPASSGYISHGSMVSPRTIPRSAPRPPPTVRQNFSDMAAVTDRERARRGVYEDERGRDESCVVM